jgi:hypothetical protein
MLQSLVGSLLQPALSGELGARLQAPGPLYNLLHAPLPPSPRALPRTAQPA